MKCTNSYIPATVIAIPLLAMVLDVRAQQQLPSETYTADLLRPWTCDSYAERQARGWPPAGGGPFVVPLAEDPSPPGGEPVPQFIPPYAATPPSLGFNFAGAQYGQDSGYNPPDTMGAVGPNHFMEVINGNVSIFRKSDGTRIASEDITSFFQHEGAEQDYYADPRVLFDQHSGRWIVIAPDFISTIAVAVSQSDDLTTGTFCKTSFVASAGSDADAKPDYPTLGVDANGIYIGADMSPSIGPAVWAIEKGPLIVDSSSTPSWGRVTAWRELPGLTSQPAHTYGTPGSEHIIALEPAPFYGLRLRIYRVDPGVDPPLSAPTMYTWTIPVAPFSYLLGEIPALDSSVSNGPGDRLMMSVYRDGSLWTTHSINVNGRWGIRWYQIDPTHASAAVPEPVIQWGNVGHPSLHFYMPSLMVNRAGHVALAFSGSDASSYVGAYYTGRRAGDPDGDMAVPQLLKAGEGPYIGRWGDYSYTTLDPADESTMWTIQEYAAPTGIYGLSWGTWIAALGPFGICNDNNGNSLLGNSPLVCVDWDGALPPQRDLNFTIDTISDSDNPNATLNPNVTFVTGNDGWNVWSQVSRSDATQANLGHIKIDPDAGLTDDFGVTVAHLASAGAANVASMALVKTGWTGQSSIASGSITDDLTGDLLVQESGGQGGVVSLTIGGDVTGDVTINRLLNLEIAGEFSGTMVVNELLGPLTIARMSGTINVIDDLEGQGSILVKEDIVGSIFVDGDVNGEIVADADHSQGGDITGNLTITNLLTGRLCGNNLSPNQALPTNITIGCGIGTTGTICGQEPACPAGIVSSATPLSGRRDARQPHPANDNSLLARQGIGSPWNNARPEDRITMTLSASGVRAISHDCWPVCETGIEPTEPPPALTPNKIACLSQANTASNAYEVKLDRPISAKNWTTIRYVGGGSKISYASLPGNINGDNYTNSSDLLTFIECCQDQSCTPPFGMLYGCDIDHSGEVNGADLLAFYELLEGNQTHIAWYGMNLPTNSCAPGAGGGPGPPGPVCQVEPCDGGGGAMNASSGFSGMDQFGSESFTAVEEQDLEAPTSAQLNQEFADWLVDYLATASPADDEAQDRFESIIDSMTQWCIDQFAIEERAALAARLGDSSLDFVSDAGAQAAMDAAETISP